MDVLLLGGTGAMGNHASDILKDKECNIYYKQK